jgi:hypothetical protein
MFTKLNKIIFILVISIFFLSVSAHADKGVFNANVAPEETFTNIPTTIKISAEIGAENLYISSVMAYKTTEDGKPLSRLGIMYDDGTHGDVIEADTIFTLEYTVNETSPTTIYIRVTAAYELDRNRYISDVLPVKVYSPIPEDVTEEIMQDLNSFQEKYNDYLQKMPIENAMQAILSDILSDTNVSDAEMNKNTITIIFKNGLRGIILLDDPSIPVQGSGSAVPPNTLPDDAQFPGNDKLMIWSPHYSNNLDFNADHAQDRFGQSVFMGFSPNPPTITADTNASLNSVKNWGDYGAVIIDTHGGISTVNGQDQVIIETGSIVTRPLTESEQADWNAGRISPSGSNRWLIFPSYITTHANNMQNTFFWLGACHSLDNDTMWDAIRGKGGKVAFGWNGTVSVSFEDSTFEKVINGLVENDPDEDILTVQQVFDNIGDRVDGWCPFGFCIGGSGATLELKTANADWSNFLFYEGGIINGDFETGDWTGWEHGGDYSYRIISGARKHTGSFSAALGRWDTSYHGYDPAIPGWPEDAAIA